MNELLLKLKMRRGEQHFLAARANESFAFRPVARVRAAAANDYRRRRSRRAEAPQAGRRRRSAIFVQWPRLARARVGVRKPCELVLREAARQRHKTESANTMGVGRKRRRTTVGAPLARRQEEKKFDFITLRSATRAGQQRRRVAARQ